MTNGAELSEITKFLENLQRDCFEESYLETHRNRIEVLRWLKAYYEGRTGCTPKELLETVLLKGETFPMEGKEDWIQVLYFWVYHRRVEGF